MKFACVHTDNSDNKLRMEIGNLSQRQHSIGAFKSFQNLTDTNENLKAERFFAL